MSVPGDINENGVLDLDDIKIISSLIVQSYSESNLEEPESEDLDLNFYNSWKNYDEMLERFNIISTPHISIGKTYENHDIKLFKCGSDDSNKPIMVIIGTQHCREWLSPMSCIYIIENLSESILSKYEVHVIPVVNVDGYIYTHTTDRFWRKNREPNYDINGNITYYGTDLNRNWDGPEWGNISLGGASNNPSSNVYQGSSGFSSPELKVLRDYLNTIKDRLFLFIDIHTYSAAIGGVWGYTYEDSPYEAIQESYGTTAINEMTSVANYTYEWWTTEDLYVTTGDSVDYVFSELNSWAYFFELRPSSWSGGGFDPPEETILDGCREALIGIESLANSTNGEKPGISYIFKKKVSNNKNRGHMRRCRCGEDLCEFDNKK
tara:strand:- start:95 stop:1228 length:1134 start_codon:yes stop_codon:yes gene_type:complete